MNIILNQEGRCALFYACYNNQAETVKLLLEYGAEASLLCDICQTHVLYNYSTFLIVLQKDVSSLYIASKLGFAVIVQLLVKYGVQVNVPYKVKWSKIHNNNVGIVCLIFLFTQLNVGIQMTALHTACLNGHSQVVKLLIENGAMIDSQTVVSFNFKIVPCSHHCKLYFFSGWLYTIALSLHKQTVRSRRYTSECWSYARYCAECNKNTIM